MKKHLYFLFILISALVYSQETLHVDFDQNNAGINFASWNNSSSFEKVNNPYPDSNNSSEFVGQFTAGNDNGIGVGSDDFSSYFNMQELTYFKINVWASNPIDVKLKLENGPDWGNHNYEVIASLTASQVNQWTELIFDFSDVSDVLLNKIVIFMDPEGNFTSEGDVYYFDDIIGPPFFTAPGILYSPSDGEIEVPTTSNLEIINNYGFRNLDDSEINNPDQYVYLTNIDTNESVGFTASINDYNNTITINPNSNLESLTNYQYGVIDESIEHSLIDTPITGVNASFTSKEISTEEQSIMLYDFDENNPDAEFVSWDGNSLFSKVSNPDVTSENSSDNVGQFIAGDGLGGGGGWSPLGITMDEFIDFGETPYIRMKIWADSPIEVEFKFENDPDYWEQTAVKYTLTEEETNQWTEIVFNFSGETLQNQNKINIYFDGERLHTEQGDVYYFDEIQKSNIPPSPSYIYYPFDGETDVVQYIYPNISTNFKMRNIDDTPIVNPTSLVELRIGDENGDMVPFNAAINDTMDKITLIPDNLLDSNTVYWYGIIDNSIEFEETGGLASDIGSSFTTTSNPLPEMVIYDDFDSDSNNVLVLDTMGDPPSVFDDMASDPTGNNNTVLEWNKSTSWWGWERIHIELSSPIDGSGDDIYSIRVYSPHKTYMRYKIADAKEDGDITSFVEKDNDILLVNTWQNLYFDFSDLDDGVTLNHLFVFIAGGDASEDRTYYIDDIKGPALTNTASIGDNELNTFSFYPNPADNLINIESNNININKIKIYDMNGRFICNRRVINNSLNVGNLSSGIYFIEINGVFKKLIKK
tara:strand:- start:1639 stop:4083 length:2445 start_codon:yes stop_codon:yes gene_type:complete